MSAENLEHKYIAESFNTNSSQYEGNDVEQQNNDIGGTWPWINHIDENGDVLYILHNEPKTQLSLKSIINRNQSINQTDNSSKNLQTKIKTALKKSRSFGKKDIINSKSNSSDYNAKQNIQPRLTSSTSVPQSKVTCANVVIKLDFLIEKEFVNIENVFGIISGLDMDPVLANSSSDIFQPQIENCIFIQGIIPNSPAEKSSQIKIGDYLVAVNGVPVNLINIENVLMACQNKLEYILTIERKIEDEIEDLSTSIVLNVLTPKQKKKMLCHNQLCVFANLTLDGNEKDPESDIVFWFPDTEHNQLLREIRGVFLTLSDALKDLSQFPTKSTELLLNDAQVNVSYYQYRRNVIVLALPIERCSAMKLNLCLEDLVKFLELHHGTIEKCFEKSNIESTEHLILMFLEMFVQNDRSRQTLGISSMMSFSNQHYVEISSILSDLEAEDYGECIDNFFPHRRLYSTYGTCLFYKGGLICSHLPDRALNDILIFCKYHWLHILTKESSLNQLVLWKEIYLSSEMHDGNSQFISPIDSRWFILIVGQNNTLLCTILEVGGIASVPEGNPGPHPYFVDTAASILAYLIESFGIEKICEEKLTNQSNPSIVKAKESANPRSMKSPRALVLTQRKCVGNQSDTAGELSSSQYISESFDRRGSLESSSSNHGVIRTDWSSSSIHSTGSLNVTPDVNLSMTLSTKLTSGYYNTLFYFVRLQSYRGLFISPQSYVWSSPDSLTQRILRSFHVATEKIHSMFSRDQGRIGKSLEHGVLFHLEQNHGAEFKVNAANIAYWVVGRLMKNGGAKEEEIFVCFQDGIPQNVVEMAFKLGYGCYT